MNRESSFNCNTNSPFKRCRSLYSKIQSNKKRINLKNPEPKKICYC